jgi:adenylylsulfate kinase
VSSPVVWITGLPQTGKSTLARRIQAALDRCAVVIDSDHVRDDVVPGWGYDDRDRDDFYESLARMAARLAAQDLVVLVAATANLTRYRDRARALAPAFLEVYVTADAAEAARRDQKGLYRDAPGNLPGAGARYEAPRDPDVVAGGGFDEDAIAAVIARLA